MPLTTSIEKSSAKAKPVDSELLLSPMKTGSGISPGPPSLLLKDELNCFLEVSGSKAGTA